MATSISARLSRAGKKQDVPYNFNSTSTALISKLRQEGQLTSVENMMHAIEQVSSLLLAGFDGQIKDSVLNMCQHLKVYGACLEVLYKDQLDRAFVVFRNSSQDEEKLDYQSRLHLLELIELRANQWKGTDYMSQYYKKKITHTEIETTSISDSASSMSLDSVLSPNSPPLLAPGEIMKSSGKFPKPTRIPGKNYCKDEVVIRNADSGKVMGIKGRRVHMIEELSETIISFQRVNPGAKERLVQITGAYESSISHAKHFIEDTIRRNASPVREHNPTLEAGLAGSSSSLCSSASDDSAPPTAAAFAAPRGPLHLPHSFSMGDASIGEYKYTVSVRGHAIKITGHNLDLVKMSKVVLDEFFANKSINGIEEFYSFETLPRSPLSPPDSNETDFSRTLSNGQPDESTTPLVEEVEYKPLRRPYQTAEDSPVVPEKAAAAKRLEYPMEFLARMAMSPLCVSPPHDWARICIEHPGIARKVVDIFDADQYLSNRASGAHNLCTSASDDSILSGSSV